MRTILGTMLALTLLVADLASAAARELAVPADKAWMHAQTQIVLRPRIAGLTRTALSDATTTEADVAAQFESPDHATSATLYLFHSALPDASVWFDRARATLEARDLFRHAAPASETPIAFATAGMTLSALRQTYAIVDGPNRSTALAVMPLGEWLIALRMTGRENSAALDRRMTDFIVALRLPADTTARAAAPIAACPTPLAYGKAKMIKSETSDLLLSFLGMMAAQDKKADAVPATAPPDARAWCREGEPGDGYAAYRHADDTMGYALAIHDAGRIVWTLPSIGSQIAAQQTDGKKLVKTPSYAVTLSDVDGRTLTFPSFSALPAPRRVYEVIIKERPLGSAMGRRISLDPAAVR